MIWDAFFQWLLVVIETHRLMGWWWVLATVTVTILTFVFAWRVKLLNLGIKVWIAGILLDFIWEMALVLTGMRFFTSMLYIGFLGAILEILLHGATETGSFLLLGVLVIYKLKLINLDAYKDVLHDN